MKLFRIINFSDLVVLDGVELDYEAFKDQIIYSFGLVSGWSSLITMKVSCSYDVTKFPYDSQECPVAFGPWGVANDVYRLGEYFYRKLL